MDLPEEQRRTFNKLKSKLTSLATKVRAIVNHGRGIAEDRSKLFLYKGMYLELKPYFTEFSATFEALTDFCIEINSPQLFPTPPDTDVSKQVQALYFEGLAIYEQYMNPTPIPGTSNASSSNVLNESRTVRARLPQIDPPKFSGNPREWPLFRDTFLSLIHNEASLSNMEKLLFLVSCLSGPAKSLISNVSLAEENYDQAWKLLKEHYNDKRRLAYTYLKQILEFKPFTGKPTAANLKLLVTKVIECVESFKHLDVTDPGDFILAFLLLRCLDPSMKLAFEKKYSGTELPTLENVVNFIKVEWRSMEVVIDSDSPLSSSNPSSTSHFSKQPRNAFFVDRKSNSTSTSTKKPSPVSACPACQANHSLYQCWQFKKASASEKLRMLENWQGCVNCLSGRHSTSSCSSMRRCSRCNQAHHTWLHPTAENEGLSANQQSEGVSLSSLSGEGEVLLGTAIIQARTSLGDYKDVRIVTDSGSQFSFITLEGATKLNLVIEPCSQHIAGIGQLQLPNVIGKVRCSLRSKLPPFSSKELASEAIVVQKITNPLPQASLPSSLKTSYNGFVLADPNFCNPGPVEFLLGGNMFFDIITGQPVVISKDIPRLLPTIFGFIVAGPLTSQVKSVEGSSLFVHSTEDMKDIMARFWEVEEALPVDVITGEDNYCEQHFQQTHYRLPTGRYVVSLPVKDTISTLENPCHQALKRLMNLELKLNKDPQLRTEYHQFMRDYIELGHMKPVPSHSGAYTLPHHAVFKMQGDKKKLRTVFDASCRSKTGSLNDHLLTGPKLQLDIRDILTNFRAHTIVFTADIIKMYRQIEVHPPDRKYQHILWRFDPTEAVQEYELCTVTYGENCAPFAAQRTLKQLVLDEGGSFPNAAKTLLNDTYVDDIAGGAENEEEALLLQSELIQLLSKGCFKLSKWASNSETFLRRLPEDQCQISAVSLSSEEEPKIKLLGMQWIPKSDIFTYEISIPDFHSSKRAILSAIARIYDPLGLLSPVVFCAKLILQDTWIAQCGWDDQCPSHIALRWHDFLSQMSELSQVKIPRRITSREASTYCIVGFCDASSRGYSAVLYLVITTPDAQLVHLLKSKTKLAPIKPMTIPRLELSGALLLSRLFKSSAPIMSSLSITEYRLYTDSEIVLGWLSTPPQHLKTFVAHRVVQVLEVTGRSHWNHVRSEDNPADCSSRGLLPSQLVHHPLWWAGPSWLTSPTGSWPSSEAKDIDLPELKKSQGTALTTTERPRPLLIEVIEKFSSYTRLIRSIAYLIRFIKHLRHQVVEKGPLKLSELREAKIRCIRATQEYHQVDSRHLQSLNAFQDDQGLLRVGGRIQDSSLSFDAKHPIILSSKSHFIKLLIDYHHISYLHLGPTALQSIIGSQYWIVSARQLIRHRIFKCLKCYRANHSPQVPLMGNLPSYRLEEGKVFHHVGVDFGGPFAIRESLRRKAAIGKAYLCLFICMATKAIHLEVVSSCSTEAFLAALDRFSARRGKPSFMYSDCGTNFVGAANRLRDLIHWLRRQDTQERIIQHTADQEIHWSFNPPSAPHFGGIWEAGIKSAKSLLHKTVGDTPLTFEELATLFCNIEGILNSRPLTPISTDAEVIECLTPGHFLIGKPLLSVPTENLADLSVSPLKRWDLIKRRSLHFWDRWRTEYLHQLQQRRKWTKETKNLATGDLVLISEPNAPPRSWPMARVLNVHPGKDGRVRVVSIKTPTGVYKRPVAKLIPLTPINKVESF